MKCTMQQLRASRSEWEATPDIIPEGAIALVEDGGGGYFIKVGDGESSFSALPFFGSRVISSSDAEIELGRSADIRLGAVSELTLTLPSVIDPDFFATLTLDTNSSPMISYPEGISFTGSNCVEGVFTPAANTHYTLFFWYDGAMQCTVRGVAVG